ncbi:MAG: heme-binding protein [Dehalococcoidales bacterium]|nr:heme-binding protein [Dehalococcoidales bacterium]
MENGGEVIGGVGVSGGTPEEDIIICQATITAIP